MREGWQYKRLGDVLQTVSGGTPSKERAEYFDGSIPWLRSGEVSNRNIMETELTITDLGLKNSSAKWVPQNSVVIAMYGATVGQVGILRVPATTNQAICSILPTPDICPDFLYYYFLSKKQSLVRQSVGGAQPNISQQIIKNTIIPMIHISEQERIVAELDLLTGIIDKQKAQLQELDTLAQSIFYDMFSDPVENEKGWEIKEMGELFNVGSSKRVFESQWTESGVPFYRAREIVRMSKDEPIESPIFISEELFAEYSNRYGVPSVGDMMVTAVGTLGVSYMVKKTDRFYFKDGNILWFNSKGLCETRFIKDQYATDFVVNQIQGNANAAVVGTYTIMNAKKTRVIVPPRDLQKQYVEKVESIDKQKAFINQSIAETQKLFDYTMDKYFG